MTAPARLGTPLRVGRLELRNRVVSPPMERNYGTADGRLTDRYRDYLRARAAGGAALVFTEATYVRADGRGRAHQLGAHADHIVPGLAALADAVHAEGARLGVELNHAGRVADPAVSGCQPVAPSVVPFRGRPPRELTTGEVEQVVTAFEAAAHRCATAGVDVLELHAAHGYLVHQFLSPRTNRRTDRYADPVLFLTEVLSGIRRAAPAAAVFLRLSAFEGVPDGLDIAATLELTGRMPLDLVDALDISAGCYEAGEWIVQPGEVDRGVLAPYAARFRRFGKPIAVAGRIPTGEAAERILKSGAADLVAVGRAQHADPAWTTVTLAGGLPRPCIGCNQGCIDVLHTQQPIWCLTNPATGHESGSPARGTAPAAGADSAGPSSGRSSLAGGAGFVGSSSGRSSLAGGAGFVGVDVARTKPRTVVVVGAGLAGLEAARTAARAGHVVTVLEAGAEIGGQFRLAARLPAKPEFGRLLDWYAAELAGLAVDVRLSTDAAAATVARAAPDVVVLAVGGIAFRPPVAGIDHPRVTTLADWLGRPRPVDRDAVVTVWGADRVGVAVADAASVAGHRVLLIGAAPELAPEAGPREKGLPVRRLTADPDVEIRLDSTLEAIDGDRLLIGHAGRRDWVGVAGPVIVSQGLVPRPDRPLPGRHRTVVLGVAADAADAIRQGAAISF